MLRYRIRAIAITSRMWVECGGYICRVGRVGVGWGDVGRGSLGCGSRVRDDGLGGRHHGGRHGLVLRIACKGGSIVRLVTSSRVRVVVYPRMSRQFVGATEAFGATGKVANVWLLSCMCPDMSCLMF